MTAALVTKKMAYFVTPSAARATQILDAAFADRPHQTAEVWE